AQHSKESFKKIFDGKSLKGWKGDTLYWHVEDKCIVGEVTPETILKTNTFLIYDKELGDFELKAEFKITEAGNSGINYRSELFPGIPFALKGYQADIDGKNVYTGQNYEERGRAFLAKRGEIAVLEEGKAPTVIASIGDSDSLKNKIKSEDWNTIHIIAKGNKMRHYINGVLMSEVTDNDATKSKASGWLGLQVHVGPPMKVQYRNIYLSAR
ncbi:MAG: DUF1080 domain-containing protein, partial [Chitinophagaceae bacterium]|nr:DUF1080 domain-containing protein [Chitinophagaceae bacterium]